MAFASLRRCRWAKQFYDAQRTRNKGNHAALRALGNRRLEILWHCLTKRVRHNDAIHAANRTRALNPAASAAA